METFIGYPNELLDDSKLIEYYRNLTLSNSQSYLESAIRIDDHGKEFICSRFRKPANRSEWVDHASSIFVNANYNGKTNGIQIIAAILQGEIL